MIIDRMKNAAMYFGVNKRMEMAFHYLQTTDLTKVDPGRYEIDGHKVYALVQQYETKTKDKGRWEAHRKYIDVQYLWEGAELFGYSYLENLRFIGYDENKDFLTLEGEGDYLTMQAGTFIILAPQDAHMPGIAISAPQPVKKVVVKVAV